METNTSTLPSGSSTPFRFSKKPLHVKHEFSQWEFLQSPTNCVPSGHKLMAQGSRETKFTSGFYRRNFSDIRPELERLTHAQERLRSQTAHSTTRMTRLKLLDSSCGYNIINGKSLKNSISLSRQHKRYLADSKSEILKREGELSLRNSSHRFFRSFQEREQRQDLLNREGLLIQKKSSEIGIGRPEIISHGVPDAFDKSLYLNKISENNSVCEQEVWKAPVCKKHSSEVIEVRNLPKQ